MRKFLLIFTALLFSLFTVRADEGSFKIVFSSSGTSSLDAKQLKNAITEGEDYVSSFSEVSNVYGGGKEGGVRLASSNNPGKFTLTLSPFWQKKITRVVVNAQGWSSSEKGSLTLGGSTTGAVEIGDAKDYEFTGDPNMTWQNLIFSTLERNVCI